MLLDLLARDTQCQKKIKSDVREFEDKVFCCGLSRWDIVCQQLRWRIVLQIQDSTAIASDLLTQQFTGTNIHKIMVHSHTSTTTIDSLGYP
jgi:hypothetical protein